jgi:hypothetical protein
MRILKLSILPGVLLALAYGPGPASARCGELILGGVFGLAGPRPLDLPSGHS